MIRKIALLAGLSLLITGMMPRRPAVNFHFAPGEVWESETLTAPFDIPIYKSIEQLVAERKKLMEEFQPVFRLDTLVAAAQLRTLAADLTADPSLGDAERERILDAFRYVYRKGIVSDAERASYADRMVRTDSAHVLQTVYATDLFTPSTAQTYLQAQGIDPEQAARYLTPSLTYDQSLNARLREQLLSRVSRTEGIIRTGEVIVAAGQMIDRHTASLLTSYRREYENRLGRGVSGIVLFLGKFLLVASILTLSYVFFRFFSGRHFAGWKPLLFVFVLYTVMAGLMALVVRTQFLSPYLVPLPVVAILLLAFFDTRVAIFGNISVVLLASLFVRSSFEFFTVDFLAGMVAIFVVRHYYQRHSVFKAVGAVLLAGALVYVAFMWMTQGTLYVDYRGVLWFVASAFLMLAFYQLVYIFERLFGFVSDITLLELSDTNQPLLLQLAEKAPGTFQHSVQVASLAESAAKEIGANPLLARTGALYHDIGKMENAFYFVENQTGNFNPHSMLRPAQSAAIVRSHVTEGITLARKYRLPAMIQEFISGHHGTSKIYYFYAEEGRLHDGVVEHPDEFTYPGPKPVRREVAICMMADSVEAASRSLASYDKESIDALVEKIVDRQVAEHQFSHADLSFAEVTRIKELFKAKLNNIYHSRVSYPATV
ncbi:HDIG domain-containing metalloprotein [uncultured Rikenella sp.]|uniref:HD family phosphohydrolase n=1 Tax=uncultured Rikenella sp. TaxID=368003 RepID=UPI0026114E7E|nr:HDIG domain-containing metalloprotein [uncultured Rikenella sp.]